MINFYALLLQYGRDRRLVGVLSPYELNITMFDSRVGNLLHVLKFFNLIDTFAMIHKIYIYIYRIPSI